MRNIRQHAAFGLIFLAIFWLASCGGGGGSSSPTPPAKTTPSVTVTPSAASITNAQALSVTVTVSGSPTPTGSVTLTSGSYASSATSLSSGSATISIPANSLAAGNDALTVTYTPDAASASTYNSSSGTATVTVTARATPTVTVTPSASSITIAQALSVAVTVSGSPAPTGSVTLTSGSYTSAAATLTSGSASINVPAGSLATGNDTLSVTYTPDTASAALYNSASGTAAVTVTARTTPAVTVTPSPASITTAQALTATIGLSGSPAPTGSVVLSSGSYTSAAATLISGSASINVPAGSLAVGTDTLTATYTPDAGSAPLYNSATGSGTVTVTSTATYVLTVASATPASGISITVSPSDNNGAGAGTTPFTRTYNAGTQVTLSAPLSQSGNSFVSWSGCTSNPSASLCNVTMNSAATVTATYNSTQPPTITSITVSPTTATIGTQVQFTANVTGTGAYSTSVTWSVSASGSSLSAGTISATGLYTTPYPAPATVTVTATSTQDSTKSGSATVTLSQPAAAAGPSLNVDVNTPNTPSENPHTIHPYVYGVNAYLLDTASAKIANPALIRWGGDDTSRYNYLSNMTNAASDYYFENFLGAASMYPDSGGGNGTSFTQFVSAGSTLGAAALGTVPVLGWVANSTQYACSFNTTTYPGQTSANGSCGSGVYASGYGGCASSSGCAIYGNNTVAAITSLQETPPDITSASTPAPGSSSTVMSNWANGTWSGGWVNSLVSNPSYGNGASGKGVAIWDLDNEPTWWDQVHRDVHPVAFTYDEVSNNGIGTALAIKTADPTALVGGPVIDYWWAYFYSKKDIEAGWSTAPCYQPWSSPTDRQSHGGVPMIEYYLQQFQKYSQNYGVRLLDYVDIHGYFEPDFNGVSVGFTTAGDTAEQEARMNGTRVFWDPAYTDPNYPQPNYLTDANHTTSCSPPAQAPQLIPMLKTWVTNDYPGTKTAIDEYNFGGLESINGAVVEADILGIFGRQGLDLGAFWPTTTYNTQAPGNYAFAMYRNYDGNNSMFGDTYLQATSTSSGADAEGQLAVYGALRTKDNVFTIMVINKTYGALTSTINLENFTAPGGTTAQVYQYSNANLNAILAQPPVPVAPPAGSGTTSTLTETFPAQSITLLLIPE